MLNPATPLQRRALGDGESFGEVAVFAYRTWNLNKEHAELLGNATALEGLCAPAGPARAFPAAGAAAVVCKAGDAIAREAGCAGRRMSSAWRRACFSRSRRRCAVMRVSPPGGRPRMGRVRVFGRRVWVDLPSGLTQFIDVFLFDGIGGDESGCLGVTKGLTNRYHSNSLRVMDFQNV